MLFLSYNYAMLMGNLGLHRSVGDGVYELKIDFGSGYRIYFGKIGSCIILLLCAGDKKTQQNDIEKAKKYFQDFKDWEKSYDYKKSAKKSIP